MLIPIFPCILMLPTNYSSSIVLISWYSCDVEEWLSGEVEVARLGGIDCCSCCCSGDSKLQQPLPMEAHRID